MFFTDTEINQLTKLIILAFIPIHFKNKKAAYEI